MKAKLEAFKKEKAREVIKMHRSSKKSIESIVNMLKEQLSYEALCIIDSRYKRSAEKEPKSAKEGGSTLPSSA